MAAWVAAASYGIPTDRRVQGLQALAWALTQYGSGIDGQTWGAPVERAGPGGCPTQGGRLYVQRGALCLEVGDPDQAAARFVPAALDAVRTALDTGDADAIAAAVKAPPFSKVLTPAQVASAASEVATALGEPLLVRRAPKEAPPPPAPGGSSLAWWVGGTLIVGSAVGGAVWLARRRRGRGRAR